MIPALDLVKDLIQTKLGQDYKVASFYKTIESGNDVERYVETMQEMIDQANETQYKCFCIVSQIDDGAITYVNETTPLIDLGVRINLQCDIKYKEEVLSDIEDLIAELSSSANHTGDYTIAIAFTNPTLDMPSIRNDYEMLSIDFDGDVSIGIGNILASRDLMQVSISIPSENIAKTSVLVAENNSQYSINMNINKKKQ